METWHNARSSVLFMRDNNPARPLQVRVEVISGYQPVVYTGLSTEALIT